MLNKNNERGTMLEQAIDKLCYCGELNDLESIFRDHVLPLFGARYALVHHQIGESRLRTLFLVNTSRKQSRQIIACTKEHINHGKGPWLPIENNHVFPVGAWAEKASQYVRVSIDCNCFNQIFGTNECLDMRSHDGSLYVTLVSDIRHQFTHDQRHTAALIYPFLMNGLERCLLQHDLSKLSSITAALEKMGGIVWVLVGSDIRIIAANDKARELFPDSGDRVCVLPEALHAPVKQFFSNFDQKVFLQKSLRLSPRYILGTRFSIELSPVPGEDFERSSVLLLIKLREDFSAVNTNELIDILNLTQREKQIYCLIVDSYTNSEIASKLCISSQTVATHIKNISRKLGLKGKVELRSYVLNELCYPE